MSAAGRWRLWLPLAIFVALAGVVAVALYRPADRTVRSALVGRPLPPLRLPAMIPGKPAPMVTAVGPPRLVNVFASWCIPCAAEAPQLMRLKAMGVPIDAVAVRDTPQAVAAFLARYGDPYRAIGDDRRGQVQVSLGSSGVPESYVVGADGHIALQHVGDIRPEDVAEIAAAVGVTR
jgi:cytochrome c biogenesis protein CcmG/thiol:disulfide interchange protein DsbE